MREESMKRGRPSLLDERQRGIVLALARYCSPEEIVERFELPVAAGTIRSIWHRAGVKRR